MLNSFFLTIFVIVSVVVVVFFAVDVDCVSYQSVATLSWIVFAAVVDVVFTVVVVVVVVYSAIAAGTEVV